MINIKFTPVLPKKLNVTAMTAEVRRAMQRGQVDVYKDFQKTVATWESKPDFKNEFTETDNEMRFEVSTDDEIYGYVNNGTRAHPIPISGFAALSFMWAGPGSYKAKTKPRKISSTGGGPSGPMVVLSHVDHPGTEPRDFDSAIMLKNTPKLSEYLRVGMKKARVASGHAI